MTRRYKPGKSRGQLATEAWNVLQRIDRGEVRLRYIDGAVTRLYEAGNGWTLGVFYDGSGEDGDWDYVDWIADPSGDTITYAELARRLGDYFANYRPADLGAYALAR